MQIIIKLSLALAVMLSLNFAVVSSAHTHGVHSVRRVNTANVRPNRQVRVRIFEGVYFFTTAGGIARLDPVTQQFDTIEVVAPLDFEIFSGKLWVNTAEALKTFDLETGEQVGLPKNLKFKTNERVGLKLVASSKGDALLLASLSGEQWLSAPLNSGKRAPLEQKFASRPKTDSNSNLQRGNKIELATNKNLQVDFYNAGSELMTKEGILGLPKHESLVPVVYVDELNQMQSDPCRDQSVSFSRGAWLCLAEDRLIHYEHGELKAWQLPKSRVRYDGIVGELGQSGVLIATNQGIELWRGTQHQLLVKKPELGGVARKFGVKALNKGKFLLSMYEAYSGGKQFSYVASWKVHKNVAKRTHHRIPLDKIKVEVRDTEANWDAVMSHGYLYRLDATGLHVSPAFSSIQSM